MTERICDFCNEPCWRDENVCIFHTQKDNNREKDINFRSQFNRKVRSKDRLDFFRYVFPKDFRIRLDVVESEVDFNEVEFCGKSTISSTKFMNKVIFNSCRVNGTLTFEDVIFNHSVEFSYFFINSKSRSDTIVFFNNVTFPPNATLFRHIVMATYNSTSDHNYQEWTVEVPVVGPPVFVFRRCCLRDVYFDSCDMGLFSFFMSSFFENAHIVACEWPSATERLLAWMPFTIYTRKYVIPEEWIIRQIINAKATDDEISTVSSKYDISGNFRYEDVGSIYRRIKTSLDNNKAYEEAAWLYFNEIEMKRKGWMGEFRTEKWYNPYKKLPPFLWGLIYGFYKICAGYGERPLNSAISFVLFLFLFASLHLLNGLQFGARAINYDFSLGAFGTFLTVQFWYDWGEGLKYAILRLVPLGYVPAGAGPALSSGVGLGDVLLSLANTTILTLLLIFVGIGLKRHFKRF